MLTHLVREKDVINGEFQRAAIRERQYAQTYVDPATYQSADGVTLRNNLIEGAKAFLEAQ